MKVAVLVPWRSDNGGRRDQLWAFTRKWIERCHPDWEIFEGHSPEGPFNRGAAINDAAAQAGDWDVAVITDADNIAHGDTVALAASTAYETNQTVFAFEVYIYLDGPSTDALMAEGNWFIAPYKGDKGYGETVKFHHYSGVQAVSRTSWERVGGFIELTGWGADDAVMEVLFEDFGGGIRWLHGGAYHLFHPPLWYAQPAETGANRRIYSHVLRYRNNPAQLRRYLQSIGHPIP